MKKSVRNRLWLILASLVMITVAACGKSSTTAEEKQKSADSVVLTVTNGSRIKTFTMSQLKELPMCLGSAGQIDNNNKITGPDEYRGVALGDILNTIGGISPVNRVKISALDNNSQIFSYDQIANGIIDIYDAIYGRTTTAPVMVPKLFIAFEINGTPLDSVTGPLEFGVMTCQFRVTRESLWVKKVVKIEVISAQ